MKLHQKLFMMASQALNALAFGGDPDETLSARSWREQWPTAIRRIDRLMAWEGPDHCERTYKAQQRRQGARLWSSTS